MGCLCIGNARAEEASEQGSLGSQKAEARTLFTRIKDVQTHVKRSLAQTATEGEIYDDYTFGATLGKGGYALVKQAGHKTTGIEVAIKILHLPDKGRRRISMDFRVSVRALRNRKSEAHYRAVAPQADDLNFDDIFNEIIILESLQHPNVLHFYEYYMSGHGDKIYIVTEYLKGGALIDEMTKVDGDGGFHEADARVIFRGLLDGVAYLHSRGVIHRDLKLENLIFAARGDFSSVRIVDFGLARASFQTLAPASERDGMVVGTPCYAAPEIIQGQPYSPSVDCWALGLVLYQLLTGIHPFEHLHNMKELFKAIKQGTYTMDIPEFNGVSSDAKSLVKGLLNVDARKRLMAKGALQHKWFSRLDGRPVRSRLAEVATAMKLPELRFEKGDTVLMQRERATYMLYIHSGQCEVLLDSRRSGGVDPSYRRIAEVWPGQICGERGVRLDAIQNRDAETTEEARVMRINPAPEVPAELAGPRISVLGYESGTRRGTSTQRHTQSIFGSWRQFLICRKYARKWVGPRRIASVRAVTPVTAFLIEIPQMRWVLQRDPRAYKEMAALMAKVGAEHVAARRALEASSNLVPEWMPFAQGVESLVDHFERMLGPLREGCDGQARQKRKQRELTASRRQ